MIFTVRQEKHDAIKLLAQRKLDCTTDIILPVMQDGDTAYIKLRKVLQRSKIAQT